jgi:preprotein translocase subunit SecG
LLLDRNKAEGIVMGKWEGLGFSEAIILKTMMIFVIALFIISLIFQYLIKSNKIKPSKISRLFYMDNEKFIKYWEKKRKKGKLKFVLYCDVIISRWNYALDDIEPKKTKFSYIIVL